MRVRWDKTLKVPGQQVLGRWQVPHLHPRTCPLCRLQSSGFATYAQSFWLARLRLPETLAFELSRLLPRWSLLMCLTTAVALNACWHHREERKQKQASSLEGSPIASCQLSCYSNHCKLLKAFPRCSNLGDLSGTFSQTPANSFQTSSCQNIFGRDFI